MTEDTRREEYRGWTILLRPTQEYCARFAMTLTSPEGKKKHFSAAGDTRDKALFRARQVVDMEVDHFGK